MAKKPGSRTVAPAAKPFEARPRQKKTRYSEKLAIEICERLAAGEVWSKICGHGGMPSQSALYQWENMHPPFAAMLALARVMAADKAADDVVSTARAVTPATATADRVRMGGLQWAAAKGAPHRYGARAEAAQAADRRPTRLIVRMREFEKVVGPDGRTVLREIPVEGKK